MHHNVPITLAGKNITVLTTLLSSIIRVRVTRCLVCMCSCANMPTHSPSVCAVYACAGLFTFVDAGVPGATNDLEAFRSSRVFIERRDRFTRDVYAVHCMCGFVHGRVCVICGVSVPLI